MSTMLAAALIALDLTPTEQAAIYLAPRTSDSGSVASKMKTIDYEILPASM